MDRNLFGVRKGAWTNEEDDLLRQCIQEHGEGKWHQVPIKAGLKRCRKSCRLRWLNYLKPNIKRGHFSEDEIDLMIRLRKLLGNRWSLLAGRLPGRTANDVKNYWSTRLRRNLTGDIEKDKTLKATKSTVRPRPGTFSKKLHNLSSESTSLQHIPLEKQFNRPLMLSSPPTENDIINWWQTLLGDKDSLERASSSSFQFNEDLFPNFWVEDMAQTKKGGQTEEQGGLQ